MSSALTLQMEAEMRGAARLDHPLRRPDERESLARIAAALEAIADHLKESPHG